MVSSQLYMLMAAKMIYCILARGLTIRPHSSCTEPRLEERVLSEASAE